MIREIAPRASLGDWVDSFWVSDRGVRTLCVLPDNCADLLFDLDTGEGSVVGTMTTPLRTDGIAAPAYFGIRFKPGKAGAFIGAPLHPLTDRTIPLREVGDRSRLAAQLAEAETDERRVALAERAIEARLANASPSDRRVDAAIARLTATNIAIDDVARAVGISRQHLRRCFLEDVGITPKTFARVARFRRLLLAARGSARPSWAVLAAEHGYFDQSHLIADFRELAGASPVPFFLSR